jgi:hypothetical protein
MPTPGAPALHGMVERKAARPPSHHVPTTVTQMAEAESDQGDSGRIGYQDAFDFSFTIQGHQLTLEVLCLGQMD